MTVKGVLCTIILFIIVSMAYSLSSLSDNDLQALKYYQERSYRHSYEILSVKTNPSVLERYVLARSLQELKRDSDALALFRSINPDDIKKSHYGLFLLENHLFYYSRLLAEASVKTNSLEAESARAELKQLLEALPINSVYYSDVLKLLLAAEWKSGDFHSITNTYYQAPFVTNYRELALFALGDQGRLSNIAQNLPDSSFALLKDVTNSIDPEVIANLSAGGSSRLFLFYLNQKQFGLAMQFLEAAAQKNQDEDFTYRNRFLYEYRRGNRQAALEALAGRIENGNTSLKTINLYVSLLRSERRYESLYNFFKKKALMQSSQYISEIIETLSRLERWDELAKWYKTRPDDNTFSEENTRDVLRNLAVKKPSLARDILETIPEGKMSGYSWYLSALMDLEDKKPDSAYPKLLKVLVDYPFTYEWVIAKDLELELRTNRENLFKEAVQTKKMALPEYSLKKRLYIALGLKEIAPELFKDSLKELIKSYEEVIADRYLPVSLSLPSDIKAILKSKHNDMLYLGPELLNILVRSCGDDPAAFISNLELYEKIGQAGYSTFKLNHLMAREMGGRQYLPLFGKKLQGTLYPLESFDLIVSNAGNTNDALWYLSAFREESHFKKDALSRSGAVGFAQLMPKTAEAVLRNMKKPDWSIYDAEDNINVGLVHFKELFRKYKGNPVFALAAYNAGESAVNRWIRNRRVDMPLFTEAIEYEETRDYVRKIVLTRYFYRLIYKQIL